VIVAACYFVAHPTPPPCLGQKGNVIVYRFHE
jgi:hypothetical protein